MRSHQRFKNQRKRPGRLRPVDRNRVRQNPARILLGDTARWLPYVGIPKGHVRLRLLEGRAQLSPLLGETDVGEALSWAIRRRQVQA